MTATRAPRRAPSRPRGPSTRYLNMAAGPTTVGAAGGARATVDGPAGLLSAVAEIAQGRESIVWVHESAAAAWGFPDRQVTGCAETISTVLGVECRAVGRSGWLTIDGDPKVHLAFPQYSANFRGAANALELLHSVEAFRQELGFAYVISAAKTLHTLIGSSVGESTVEPLLPGWAETAWSTRANRWGLDELGVLESAGCRWVRAFDRSGSYLSAWHGLNLSCGGWVHHPAGLLEPGPESGRPCGYWLVDVDDLPPVEGLFDPWRRQHDPPGPRWITTPLAQLAVDLADAPVPYLEAQLATGRRRSLDKAAEKLRDARTALGAPDATPAQRIALRVLKDAYASGTAWFEHGPKAPEPLARPYWNRAIRERFVANTWRALVKVTPGPFALGEIDTALFAVRNVDDVPEGLPIGTGLGQWTEKWRPLSIDVARDALAGGWKQLLAAFGEQR